MMLSDSDLRAIVARSTSLRERLGSGVTESTPPRATLSSEKSIRKWRTALGDDESNTRLSRRLKWDGVDIDHVLSRLEPPQPHPGQPLPKWTEVLNDVLDQASSQHAISRDFAGPPLPFQDILFSFVDVADRLLERAVPHAILSQLDPGARAGMKRSLLTQLALASFSTLYAEFSAYRVARRDMALTSAIELLTDQDSTELYAGFVHDLAAGGLKILFAKFPVLARVLAEAQQRWVDANAAFLQHFFDDRAELAREFGSRCDSSIQNLRASLSDAHNGGRTVIEITFRSGQRLIYKPRGIKVERVYYDLLDWINRKPTSLKLRTLKALDRDDHGWVEFCSTSVCTDSSAARRFYRRSGMLLCIVYALRGTDFHSENMIACEDQPMLVDLETLLTPDAGEQPRLETANEAAMQQLRDSVLNTYLLPQWHRSSGSDAISDRSGLGAIDSQLVEFRRLRYVNTDRMTLANTVAPLSDAHDNSPLSSESGTGLKDHIDDVANGFCEMYRILLECRDELLAPNSPLHDFADIRLRFVLRPTALYFSLLARSLEPDALRDGLERSLHLEPLCRAFVGRQDMPAAWPLVLEEQQALERLDIPSFEFRSSELGVKSRQAKQPCDIFFESGYDAMKRRLLLLGEGDLTRQLEYIRGSLYSRILVPSALPDPLTATDPQVSPGHFTDLLGRAESIGREIVDRSIKGRDGSVTWIGMNYDFEIDRHRFSVMGPGLYAGASGVALFLAALEGRMQTNEFGPAAVAALQGWRDFFRRPDNPAQERLIQQVGIGVGGGLAGLVFSLTAVGEQLARTDFIHDAERIARFISRDRIEADQDFDILGGAAGIILTLLKLHRSTREREHLDKATICGQHLLRARHRGGEGPRAWANRAHARPLTGFSHGAAGIAYSLLRLFETTGEPSYLEAAQEAIAYERGAFSVKSGNWLDLRQRSDGDEPTSCMTSWCHGAPGIGLARIAGLKTLNSDYICEEIDTALLTTDRFSLQDVDHLCCGNLGRVELLLSASKALSRPDLYESARGKTEWIVQRAGESSHFRLLPGFPGKLFNAGLFQGLAGIGYTLLRLHGADIPSILLLD